MDNSYDQQQQHYNQPQIALPNATAVLILGILSIIGCCCYGGGLILGVIALVLASKDIRRYLANPAMYTPGSYSNLKAGRVCAIIGSVFTIVHIICVIIFVSMFGWAVLSDPNSAQEAMRQMLGK